MPRLLDDLGLAETSAAVQVLGAWDAALGPELAPHCRPEGFRRGQVIALVRDSAWMQRIQLETPRILARLRDGLGEAAPQSIRLRIGQIEL
jgi:predicted nucleic acid-binding Zn ribbon protein